MFLIHMPWQILLVQELALEQGRMDVIQVFDIYLTKIPAYEREIKKKNAKSGS